MSARWPIGALAWQFELACAALCLRGGRLELACDARGVVTKVPGSRSSSVWLAAATCLRGGQLELLLALSNTRQLLGCLFVWSFVVSSFVLLLKSVTQLGKGAPVSQLIGLVGVDLQAWALLLAEGLEAHTRLAILLFCFCLFGCKFE